MRPGDTPKGPAALIRTDSAARSPSRHNGSAMLKIANFCFIASVIATPIHLVAGDSQTRVVALGLLLLSALFSAIGVQRRL